LQQTTRPVEATRVNTNLEQLFRINIAERVTPAPLPGRTWKAASRKRNPLELGLTFSLGRSHINNGQLSDLFASNAVLESAFDRYGAIPNSNSNANPGPIAPTPTPPSRLRPGIALTAGGYVKKQVTRKIRLAAGLNYKLFTTSNTLGTARDTVIIPNNSSLQMDMLTKVYTPGTSNTYSNRFLFLELPLHAEGRFVNGKIPLFWNAGVSFSRLIASNALYYDSNRRIYYKDNKLLQKNQFSLQAAVTTKLLARTANPLMAGPEFSYGVSNLLKYKNHNPKHFFYLGLKTSIALNK
jgi:hypothetical protein